jgi:nucleotide-binding universal stress UspA family protein
MTVVVAYSPDQYGRAAVSYGATEASRRGERLIVVNDTRGEAYVDKRLADHDDIEALRANLARLDVESEIHQDVVPDVAEAVLKVSAETSASLIVVGVRPRTPVGKLLLGSVAQRIILDATCPVLAVKPDGADGVTG